MAKKKIMLLSDDLRMSSGVGTMSKEFVLGTLDKYDWVQIGGAIKHPEEGKIVNMDETARTETGIKDAKLTIYPISGYGSQELLRNLLIREKPDFFLKNSPFAKVQEDYSEVETLSIQSKQWYAQGLCKFLDLFFFTFVKNGTQKM